MDQSLIKPDLHFAKIVSTPTFTSWSQAYNAGSLFAIVALTSETVPEEEYSLRTIGKDILDRFEQEYFSLEKKQLADIKQAVSNIMEGVAESISLSFIVASIQPHVAQNVLTSILYICMAGKGKVLLKRGEKLGHILSLHEETRNISTASGYLQNNDVIFLETAKLSEILKDADLASTLSLPPSEAAEIFAPMVHEKQEGDACAIMVSYKQSEAKAQEIPQGEEEQKVKVLFSSFKILLAKAQHLTSGFSRIAAFKKPSLSHKKKLFLTIALILFVVFISSIYFSIRKQEDEKTRALFKNIYPQADQKYKEGQSLIDLNKSLARDYFTNAQQILSDGKKNFKKGSKELGQIESLQTQIQSALSAASSASNVDAKSVNIGQNALLSYEAKNKSQNQLFAKDEKRIYVIDDKGIHIVDPSSTKTIIANNNNWKDIGGFGVYFNNFYVVDKSANAILKFVPSASGYSKTNYLQRNVQIDLSSASSIAIDGSIWVLSTNGSLVKFTRGRHDTFSVSKLDEPFRLPSRIFTDIDTRNLYVLDKGNSRIVVLGKDGVYQTAYHSPLFKDTVNFDVLEKDKKIYILAKNTLFEISLR